MATISLLFLITVFIVAIAAPVIASHDPAEQDLRGRLTPPAWLEGGVSEHALGTDELGRDLLSRMIFAARISLAVAVSVVAITLVLGTLLGIIAGYFGGKADHAIMGVADTLMAFPGLLMILSVAAFLGPGLLTIIAALSVRFWTTYARIARGAVLAVREADFMLSAKVIGGTEWHLIRAHLVPNMLSPIATLIPLELARVMLAEASVSFLGLGVRPPMTSWGILVAEGREFMNSAWWLITFPGVLLFLTILSSNMLGSWLRLATDPIHRGRSAS